MAPTVSGISPNVGSPLGGTVVTITGSNFSSDSVVDFGNVPAVMVNVAPSGNQITAIAPPCSGTMDVRVTNMFGTSAITPADQFTAPASAPAPASPFPPVIVAISPNSGPVSGPFEVTITGTDFAVTPEFSVTFGGTPAAQIVLASLNMIIVVAPAGTAGSVDVVVNTFAGASNSAAFTYGPPVVTKVSPACGVFGISIHGPVNALVTVTGMGFGTQGSGSIQFGGNPVSKIQSWTPTQIQAFPPNVSSGGSNQTVDVQVTSSGQTSDTVPADQYTYYNAAEIFA